MKAFPPVQFFSHVFCFLARKPIGENKYLATCTGTSGRKEIVLHICLQRCFIALDLQAPILLFLALCFKLKVSEVKLISVGTYVDTFILLNYPDDTSWLY